MRRYIKNPVVIFFGFTILFSLFTTSETIAKRFPSDVSKRVQTQLLEIEQQVGLDIPRGRITRPYSEHMGDTLLRALDSRDVEVKLRSLSLLIEVVKQLEIPKTTISNNLEPVLMSLIESHRGSFIRSDIIIVERAEQIIWQIAFKEFTKEKDRFKFLKNSLEMRSNKGFYYPFEAIDHLTKIGTRKAKKILENQLKKHTKKSMPKGLVDKIKASLEEIDTKLSLENINPSLESRNIKNLIIKKKQGKTSLKKEFLMWAIRRLAENKDPTAIQTLKDLWQDSSLEDDSRYEAQENLIQIGQVQEAERIILHDF